ncbi:MAG: hypothetical protein ABL963_15380, partial [Longimicrobiales bacterium]
MSANRADGTERGGAALVAVVLLTLALYAVGHGMLAISLGELAASHAAARLVEARAGAQAVIHETLNGPAPAWLDSVPVGSTRGASAR